MECRNISFTAHAFRRLVQRGISPADVVSVVRHGEIVESYPEDVPRPSFLLLGHPSGKALHVLVSRDDGSGRCYIVTVHQPDPKLWRATFRKRQK